MRTTTGTRKVRIEQVPIGSTLVELSNRPVASIQPFTGSSSGRDWIRLADHANDPIVSMLRGSKVKITS